ncbi:hypothetical protein ACGFNY_39530 [Streptomyces chartreusis]|uniref:hypothetical protein n=1 Tax=Streptomyces chartreusis TaxID=1969 RepID=UPI003723EAC5
MARNTVSRWRQRIAAAHHSRDRLRQGQASTPVWEADPLKVSNVETNVRIAPCALEALSRIAVRRGASRDETVRRLLAQHVALQKRQQRQDRLTHVSTVLRYPRPPRWRGDPPTDGPLRVRARADLVERARAISLRLPGQHPRAYPDYQGRMLTDTATTAIARDEPFDDDFLSGLLPLLRHGAALGLWRLAAATSTRPEKACLLEARVVRAVHRWTDAPHDVDEQCILRVAEVLEQEESWHALTRFESATGLARHFLTGPRAKEWEQALWKQDKPWENLYKRLLRADDREERRWRRQQGSTSYDWTGRDGTTVWRARRRVDLEYFEGWLVERTRNDPAARVMEEPASLGWLLCIPPARPPGWLAHPPRPRPGRTRPGPSNAGSLASPTAAGRPSGRSCSARTHPGCGPCRASNLLPPRPTGCAPGRSSASSKPSSSTGTTISPEGPVCASRWMCLPTRRAASASSPPRTSTGSWPPPGPRPFMDDFITWAADDGAGENYLDKLREARSSARAFHRLTRSYPSHKRPKFIVPRASWTWPGRSVAAELVAGAQPELLEWLATAAHRRSSLLLEQAMQAS